MTNRKMETICIPVRIFTRLEARLFLDGIDIDVDICCQYTQKPTNIQQVLEAKLCYTASIL